MGGQNHHFASTCTTVTSTSTMTTIIQIGIFQGKNHERKIDRTYHDTILSKVDISNNDWLNFCDRVDKSLYAISMISRTVDNISAKRELQLITYFLFAMVMSSVTAWARNHWKIPMSAVHLLFVCYFLPFLHHFLKTHNSKERQALKNHLSMANHKLLELLKSESGKRSNVSFELKQYTTVDTSDEFCDDIVHQFIECTVAA